MGRRIAREIRFPPVRAIVFVKNIPNHLRSACVLVCVCVYV